MNVKDRLRAEGRALGFLGIGFAKAAEHPEASRLREWLDRGYAGGMEWMLRRVRERGDPAALAPWAHTLILATLPYEHRVPPATNGTGRISRYAWGDDYHRILADRLVALGEVVREAIPGARTKPVVDTAAVLEKPWAASAGLGWQGKHTNLIDPESGSWLFVGEILTDADIEPDGTTVTDRCGTCTRCLEACPTGAFPAPYLLDSRRCISYLTIEHRGVIPEDLRPRIGNWIFGCDICQEVCPWNSEPVAGDPEFEVADDPAVLVDLLRLTRDDFCARFSGTAIRRTGWSRFLRNVAVALGNSEDPTVVPALIEALSLPDPLIREHVVWALSRLGTPEALNALREHGEREGEATVRAAFSLGPTDQSAPDREGPTLHRVGAKIGDRGPVP